MRIILTFTSLDTRLRQGLLFMKRVAISLLLLSAIGHGKAASAQQSAPDQSDILAAYNAAIYDASVYKFSNLRPLRPLKFDPATKSVSVVTLTDFKYHLGATRLPVYLWVTAVPEVQEICRGFSGDLELRLHQLFGLHPNRKISDFVVMEVKEGDIFRPTANSDPTTTLPCSYPIPANCGEAFPETISETHLRWFANQMLSSYVISESYLIPVGYPWTRLGYTYDWKPGANKYGVSEYVIRPGSNVRVTEIIPYKKYCSPA
ncbi:MAG TPA: hypothetical protein VF553_16405 [Pyrinomonadaceae bacterium]